MSEGVRIAEILATLAVATDAGMGQPDDRALRTALAAVALAEVMGLGGDELREVFDVALLRFIGCTTERHEASAVMGDEIAIRGSMYGDDLGDPRTFLRALLRVTAGEPLHRRVVSLARRMAALPGLMETARAHCEVAASLARRLSMPENVVRALQDVFERWDGKGVPARLRGEAIARSARIVHVAEDLEAFHRLGGGAAAREGLEKRAGRGLDPAIVRAYLGHAAQVDAALDHADPFAGIVAAEPLPHRLLDEAGTDRCLHTLADFVDLTSPWTAGHSTAVARLAEGAAKVLGLPAEQQVLARRAGWIHDIGRVAVSVSIWNKPGPLTATERERMRAHAYIGERILSRPPCLSGVLDVAAAAHERLDASGYHRRQAAPAIGRLARIVAAADTYDALAHDRPHRAAFPPERAAAVLREDAESSRLCAEAVSAVLEAAGHAKSAGPRRVAGLTPREIEVLRLVARGLTNKEIATALDLSVRTVSRHLENIYPNIGVTTRAAATLYAMQHDLLDA